MKTPTPHFDADDYDDLPSAYDIPRLGADFDDLDGADALDRATIAELESVWTILCRAWESWRIPLSPEEVVEIIDVYLDRERRLDPAECGDLEMFLSELGTLRSPDRAFENLTAIEFEVLMALRAEARRNLSEDELVSATLYPDAERERDLDLREAFSRETLAIADADETEQDADAGGER